MLEDAYETLWDVSWIQVPNAPYIMKYKFDNTICSFMITNLSTLFGESLSEQDIQNRFQSINPYAEMQPKVILKHVKESLENALRGEDPDFSIQCGTETLTLHLQFRVKEVSFMFDIILHLMTPDKLRTHVVNPTILTALYINQESVMLKQQLETMEQTVPSNSSKPKYDHKMKIICDIINKRSNISASESIESFLHLQKAIHLGIWESEKVLESMRSSDTTTSFTKAATSCSVRCLIKEKNRVKKNVQYEDMDEISIASQVEASTSQIFEESNCELLPQKREAETMVKTDDLEHENRGTNVKLSKKRNLKF